MVNRSKITGSRWESAICAYLNGACSYEHPASWQYIKRTVQTGAKDTGDIWAWPIVIEAKDCKSKAVPTWLRQAEAERLNAGFPFGCVVVKVRGKGPALAKTHASDSTFGRLIDAYDLSGCPVPTPQRGYHTWELWEFAEVLRTVRAQIPAPN